VIVLRSADRAKIEEDMKEVDLGQVEIGIKMESRSLSWKSSVVTALFQNAHLTVRLRHLSGDSKANGCW